MPINQKSGGEENRGESQTRVFDPIVTAFAFAEKRGVLGLENQPFLVFLGDDAFAEEFGKEVLIKFYVRIMDANFVTFQRSTTAMRVRNFVDGFRSFDGSNLE